MRDAFARLVSGPDADIELARAALLVAQDVVPQLDPAPYLARLDALGAELRRRLAGAAPGEATMGVARRFLFEEQGFRGNEDAYYDPRNSLLHEVLDRKLGIPITLSLVTIEIGRRAGMDLEGVGFPGHFLVRYRGRSNRASEDFLFDPFHGGKVLGDADVKTLLERFLGASAAMRPEYLAPASKRGLLVRLLRNLKNVYSQTAAFGQALAVTNRILAISPDSVPDLRDRGLLFLRLECWRAAAADLERYLTLAPEARDARPLRERLAWVQAQARLVN